MALEHFQAILGRARYLVRLHQGLLNQKHRAPNQKWLTECRRLMHWPVKGGLQRIGSSETLILLGPKSTLESGDFNQQPLDELLRSALVLTVSALDRYVHERTIRGIIPALRKGKVGQAQRELSMPADLVIDILQEMLSSRRSGAKVRPTNRVKARLQQQLYRMTFQSWNDIAKAFQFIGINDLRGKLKEHYGHEKDVDSLIDGLNQLVDRRNRIVHEGDLAVHRRGRRIKLHPITAKAVEEGIELIETLVKNLEKLA